MHPRQSPPDPWYRQPWVWLLIALPATAVVGGMVTIWIAIASDDGRVVDDYYRRGLEINRQLARDQAAARRGLHAQVRMSPSNRRLQVTLAARSAADLPSVLGVELIHHTRAGLDLKLIVPRDGEGRYHGPLPTLAPGMWTVRIAAEDWRLQGSSRLDKEVLLALEPLVD